MGNMDGLNAWKAKQGNKGPASPVTPTVKSAPLVAKVVPEKMGAKDPHQAGPKGHMSYK